MEQDRFAITRARLHRVHLRENVAVGDEKIEPGVVVHVKKARAPSDQTIILMAEAGSPARVLEAFRAHIAIQRIGLLSKMRDKEAKTTTVAEVAKVHTHVAELHAFTTQSQTREHAFIGKRAVMVVVIEVVWDRIVGNEEVRPTVVVVVGPDDAETIIADLIVDTGLHGNFLESAVTPVVIQKIAFTHEAPRAALHEHAFVPAILVAAELREIVHIHVSVPRDE